MLILIKDQEHSSLQKMISILLFVFLVTIILVKYCMHMSRMESYVKHMNIRGTVYPLIGNVHVLLGKSSLELFKEVKKFTLEIGTPMKVRDKTVREQ